MVVVGDRNSKNIINPDSILNIADDFGFFSSDMGVVNTTYNSEFVVFFLNNFINTFFEVYFIFVVFS